MKQTKTHRKSIEAIGNGLHSANEIASFAAVTRKTILKALDQLVKAGEISVKDDFYQIIQKPKVGEKLSPKSEKPAKSAKIRFRNPQNVGYLKKVFAFFGYAIQTSNITLFTVCPKNNLPNEALIEDLESILCFFSNSHSIDILGDGGEYLQAVQLAKLNPKNEIILGQSFVHRLENYIIYQVHQKSLIPDKYKTDKEPTCRVEFRAINTAGVLYDFVVDTSRQNSIESKPSTSKLVKRANFEAVKQYTND